MGVESTEGYPCVQFKKSVRIKEELAPTRHRMIVTDDAAGHFQTEWRRAVPRNRATLNASADAEQWWNTHRPLLLAKRLHSALWMRIRGRIAPSDRIGWVDSMPRGDCRGPCRRSKDFG
jgi:hypothetical protein